MAEKDITEKNLEDWNDVFADIVNVLLFDGDRLIKEDDLVPDTKDSMFKADGVLHEQERDVSKLWRDGEIRISIIGFENQSRQDYRMPLRVISYDGASYKRQLLDDSLSKNYPVVTLVLYFGTHERWTAPKSLYGCFDVPERLRPFVNDYKISVFEIAWLDDATIEKFSSDFKILAKYFQAKRLNADYVGSNDEIRHVDSLLKMMSALTGDNSFELAYNESSLSNKGGVTMCDVVERIMIKGINKGIEQGLEQGLEKGFAEGRAEAKTELIMNLIESRAGSLEQIAAWVKLPVEEIQRIAQAMPATN